jgi:hypothetical protein
MPSRLGREMSWNEVSEELRSVQDLISSHQSRFRDADCKDIADDLERAIGLLIRAQGVADELSRGRRWRPSDT